MNIRKIFLPFLSFLLISSSVYAGAIFHYKTYNPKTGHESNRFYFTMEKEPSGGYKVHWVIEEGGIKIEEDYILGPDFETRQWHVVNVKEDTDYAGKREGNSIIISGRFQGSEVEDTLEIDERPFYYNPKLGLMGFLSSEEWEDQAPEKIKDHFWGFQNRELKAYPMKARHEGLEVISVGGKPVEAIKVYWTVDDFRSIFFKRTYWFRKSDGLYIKQKSGKGDFRELVSEGYHEREN